MNFGLPEILIILLVFVGFVVITTLIVLGVIRLVKGKGSGS